MKYVVYLTPFLQTLVTPHEGVWIEIIQNANLLPKKFVTPHEGVWIEIKHKLQSLVILMSLPTRECGLK